MMIKNVTFAVAAGLCLAGLTSCGDAKKEAAAAVAAKPTDHGGYLKVLTSLMNDFCGVCDTIKDKASADAAAPKVEAMAKQLNEYMKGLMALGEPDAATQEKLAAEGEAFDAVMEKVGQKIAALLGNNCYESETLKKAMELLPQ